MANDNGERINKSMPTEERADRNELASPNLGSQTIKRSQVHCALSPMLLKHQYKYKLHGGLLKCRI